MTVIDTMINPDVAFDAEKITDSASKYLKMLYNVSSELLLNVTDEKFREELIFELKDLDRSTRTITSMISDNDEFVFDTFKGLVESDLRVFIDNLIDYVHTFVIKRLQKGAIARRIEPLHIFIYSLYGLDKFIRQYAISQWSLASVNKTDIDGQYLCVSTVATLKYCSNKLKPLFSASILDLKNPQWFQQYERSIMLIFNPEPEDVLGIATDDTNPLIGRPSKMLTWSLDKLFWYNELPDKYTLEYSIHYDNGIFDLENMLSRGELLLLERCKPVGVLIDGTYAAEFFGEDHNGVAVFADYWQLPVFLLTGNKEEPVVKIK